MKLKSVNIHDEHQEYKHSCAETTNTAYCKAGIYCRFHTVMRNIEQRDLQWRTIIDKQAEHSGETSVLSLRNIQFLKPDLSPDSSAAEDLLWTGLKMYFWESAKSAKKICAKCLCQFFSR